MNNPKLIFVISQVLWVRPGDWIGQMFGLKLSHEVVDKMLVGATGPESVTGSKGSSLCGSWVTYCWQEMAAFLQKHRPPRGCLNVLTIWWLAFPE